MEQVTEIIIISVMTKKVIMSDHILGPRKYLGLNDDRVA